jgi:hypothetical protein
MASNRLNICMNNAREYEQSFNAGNNYTGDSKKLTAVAESHALLTEIQKESFEKYIESNIQANISEEAVSKTRAGTTGACVGATAFSLADAYFFGPVSFFRTTAMVVGGIATGFSVGALGTGASVAQVTDEMNAKRRATKPFTNMRAAIGLTDLLEATVAEMVYNTSETALGLGRWTRKG